MDVWQKRRLRRITEAVYQAASPPPSDVEPPPKHRFLPSAHAVIALVAVVALIVVVAVVKWTWGPSEPSMTGADGSAMSSSPGSASEPSESQSGDSGTSGKTAGLPAGQSGHSAYADGSVVIVYVSGRVNAPGVVTLPVGSRVIDALEAAGGATPEADLAAINLARKVVDGEQIDVTKPGEVSHSTGASGGSVAGGAGSGGVTASCVDLNTADQATLEQLDGVGPALAQRILTYRDQVGHIESAEQLDDVSGIGPALVARITPGVCP